MLITFNVLESQDLIRWSDPLLFRDVRLPCTCQSWASYLSFHLLIAPNQPKPILFVETGGLWFYHNVKSTNARDHWELEPNKRAFRAGARSAQVGRTKVSSKLFTYQFSLQVSFIFVNLNGGQCLYSWLNPGFFTLHRLCFISDAASTRVARTCRALFVTWYYFLPILLSLPIWEALNLRLLASYIYIRHWRMLAKLLLHILFVAETFSKGPLSCSSLAITLAYDFTFDSLLELGLTNF